MQAKNVAKICLTFSWISDVDCASQNATVATSFRMGISTEQSRPSSRAINGRGCIGPLGIGPRIATENEYELQHDKTNKMTCSHRRLRWAWAATQFDQSSLFALRNLWSFHWAYSKDSDQTGWMPRLIRVLPGAHSFCWFCHVVAHLFMPNKTRGPLVLYRSPECWGYVKNQRWLRKRSTGDSLYLKV